MLFFFSRTGIILILIVIVILLIPKRVPDRIAKLGKPMRAFDEGAAKASATTTEQAKTPAAGHQVDANGPDDGAVGS